MSAYICIDRSVNVNEETLRVKYKLELDQHEK